jgi:hypothetical protein
MCIRVSWCGGSSPESIAKDCWVFPLIEKDFPKITSCILEVTTTIVYGIAAFFMVQVHAKLK